MSASEGPELLLEAVAYVRRELGRNDVPHRRDGTKLTGIRQLSRQVAVEDCAEFTGRISYAALWEIMSTADVCVNPDRANDMNDKSTMNKIIEYMALGKPIVQIDRTEGGFSAGEASLYARPNDVANFVVKLCELLDDPDRRTSMGELGRSRAESAPPWHHQVPQRRPGSSRRWLAVNVGVRPRFVEKCET